MDVNEILRIHHKARCTSGCVDLSEGVPDFDVPREIKREAIKAINSGKNRYTEATGIPELKKKIVSHLKKQNINTTFENIIVTHGVSGGLSIIIPTITNPKDEVIIFDPYFISYKELLIQNLCKPVFVKTNKDFSINLEDLKRKINRKTKAIIINNPNNPSGRVYSEKELKDIIKIVRKKNLLIISDEIYEDYCYDNKFVSVGSLYKNSIVMKGFSKSYGMTGWRLGYLVAPKEIVKQTEKVQEFNLICPNSISQYAAVKALDSKVNIKEYKKKRDFVYNSLKDKYEINKPEGAFYFYIKYPYNANKFLKDCLNKGLIIVPGNVFSKRNDYFRICFCKDNKILRKGIKILKELS